MHVPGCPTSQVRVKSEKPHVPGPSTYDLRVPGGVRASVGAVSGVFFWFFVGFCRLENVPKFRILTPPLFVLPTGSQV